MKTKERLAAALEAEGWHLLAARALWGEFDDFETQHAIPLHVLIAELRKLGGPRAYAFIQRVIDGEFDGSMEEADDWWQREGRFLLPEGYEAGGDDKDE